MLSARDWDDIICHWQPSQSKSDTKSENQKNYVVVRTSSTPQREEQSCMLVEYASLKNEAYTYTLVRRLSD